MDVGLTRSIWPTPGRFEPAKPTALEHPAHDTSRSTADGAAFGAEDDVAKVRDRAAPVQRLNELQMERAAEREKPIGAALPSSFASRGDVPDEVEQLMKKLADPIRTLLEGDRLSGEAKKALAQALTQQDADAGRTPANATDDAGRADARQRYEKMEAAFDEYLASLKQIFKIGGEAAPEAASDERATESANRDEQPLVDAETLDGDGPRRAEDAPSEREELLRQVRAAYNEARDGEKPAEESTKTFSPPSADSSADQAYSSADQAYARFAAMYTALYPSTTGRESSLNAEG